MPACTTTLLIIYHSQSGGTLQMAQAAYEGAATATSDVHTRLLHASAVQPKDVLEAHGYVFATPEYLGAMSGMLKDFFDRCYYSVLEQIQARPYACLVCAGSDGQQAAQQIGRIATGWRLREVAPPLIACTHAQTAHAIAQPKTLMAKDLNACKELGQSMAYGLQMGIF